MNSKSKYNILCLLFLIFNILLAQEGRKQVIDSITPPTDTLVRVNKESLQDIVDTQGDEIRNIFSKNTTYLIHNAKVKYEDMIIEGDYIVMDWNSGDIFARGKVDSLGKIIENITFTQGGKKFEYTEAVFNMNTKQGTAFNVRTEEEEMVIIAEKAKRMNDSEYYMRRGLMTPDEYFKAKKDSLADVEFHTNKLKLINKPQGGKDLIAGPTTMYIEQIPTPFILPFLYLPASGKKRSAGILIGSFGERQNKGFYLERWGFYVPIGEYLDLETRFGVYTKGSWMIDNKLRYNKRYRYNGNLEYIYEKNISGTKGLSDYSESNNYRFIWNHIQDPKANPNLSFNSTVNFLSQNYYNNSIYNYNAINGNVTNNQTSSSISLVKRFNNNPFTISLNASASQNISTGLVSMVLPNLSVTMPQIYPFKPKNGAKRTIFHNLYLDYKMNLQNSITTTTEDMFSSKMFDNSNNGMSNSSSFGTTSTIFNYFQFGINGNYKEVWTTKTIRKDFDPTTKTVVSNDKNDFSAYRTFGGALSLTTTLYGIAQFKKGALIQAVRHMMTPTISYQYAPDFSTDTWGYYGSYTNEEGKKIKYSYYEGNVMGSPSNFENSSLNLSIANNLEMKVRSKKEDNGVKKIKIFETFNVNTSYNFAADSLKLNPINITASTPLFNSRMKINYAMRINPYKIQFDSPTSTVGYAVDKFNFSVASFTMGLNLGLDSSIFGGEKASDKYKRRGTIRYENYYFDNEGYAHFDIPWRLDIGFNYTSTKEFNRVSNVSATVNLNGEISPAPYWKLTASTNYDLESKEFGFTRLGFSRDLRSFNINFNWVPISAGFNKTWNFYIGLKAAILKDALKYEAKNFNDQTNF
ncbi:LPS-assembly protein LptD [Apibacter muscae]|uniref:putative LPS assembly protein LptD n=1 Tax=Apibacter muscae TaxID=2509004 RepID=UPI0011ABA9FA|nr:putative LPS assembly protein LptD [Apibacter muscae]TWP27618.1 LPS-assembly protein LptD [Apibacter muscae]